MWFWTIAMVHALAAPVTAPVPAPVAPAATTDTVVVKMVNKSAMAFAFAPENVTVHRGDVLEFVQTGSIPHDVVFTKAPAGAKIGSLKVGPMLVARGQTYSITIDGRFPPGRYAYECLPHAALGMKGTFEVAAPAAGAPSSGR